MKESILRMMARSDIFRGAYAACGRMPILGSCLHRLALKVLPRGARIWTRIPQGDGEGLWFYADLRFEPGYLNGDYEPWLQELLRETLTEGDCFFDVGAHTGFSALLAARFVGEGGLVVAVEPDPRNAAVLRSNIERNQLRQVELIEAAAWSSPGEVTFKVDGDASNRSQGRVALAKTEGSQNISVPAITVDELAFERKQRPPNAIKIDVEGGEWEVLQGARRTLREVKPALLCEVHDPAMLDQLRSFLQGFGYSVEHWAPVHPRHPDYRQHYIRCASS
jgi:FkbM family methyltransferase